MYGGVKNQSYETRDHMVERFPSMPSLWGSEDHSLVNGPGTVKMAVWGVILEIMPRFKKPERGG